MNGRTHSIGVIGCGYWGPNLIRNFSALPDCEVQIVCDKDASRLAYVQELYPSVRTTSNVQDVLEDESITAVAIVTPVRTHFELARQALLAGKHVFIEKPMCDSSARCRKLIELARERDLTLMVGHTFVYAPTIRYIKELLESGEIGEVLYISSRRLNLGLFQKDINVAWDLAPHDISIILYLLESRPLSVNCQGRAHITPHIEDVTSITMSFPGNVFALIQSSWIDPRKIRELTIVGTKQMLVYDDNEPHEKVRIYDKCVEVPPHYDTFAEFQYSYHYGDMRAPYIKLTEPLRAECRHFLDCIESGRQSDSSGERGLEVVQILEAATMSLRDHGRPVGIEETDAILERAVLS